MPTTAQKHIVITGANNGIGLAVARELAGKGHRLTLLCRNPTTASAARDELSQKTDVALELVDFSDLEQTAAVARELVGGDPIDAFIHNAGIWPNELERVGAFERSFVVNHLAPFQLDRILETHFEAHGTRVVQVTAGLIVKAKTRMPETATGDDFSAMRTYANTKLCNLMMNLRWAKRWEHATLNQVHPGVVRTDLGARDGVLGWLVRQVKRTWLTPEEGARGPVFLATDDALVGKSGLYYDQLDPLEIPDIALEEALSSALWEHALANTKAP